MESATELAQLSEDHRAYQRTLRAAERNDAARAAEDRVAFYETAFRSAIATAPAAAAAGARLLDLHTESGDLVNDTASPISLAWARLAPELAAAGYRTRVWATGYLDVVSSFRTCYRISW